MKKMNKKNIIITVLSVLLGTTTATVYFLIKNKKTKIVYLTDTEYVEEIKSNKKINGAAIYICEGNYDSTFGSDNKLKKKKHIKKNYICKEIFVKNILTKDKKCIICNIYI